jgi:5-oxopent-3-ene-1,2,5-tricarboxylate decarboxylase/2-hydroxyhepta-2,4-diene-1,7-dioate isomerase
MKHARISYQGVVHDATERDGQLLLADGRLVGFDDVKWLPPLAPTPRPRSIFALGLNYADHAKELEFKAPEEPLVFLKGENALTGHRQITKRPPGVEFMHYECELTVVIGKTARNVKRASAYEYIAGYTVANDYGLHDFRDTDAGSMLRVKGSDTLCPLGPGLVTDWDFHGKRLRTYVNGEVVQDGSTDEMKWDMHYLVADIARTITLYPGDVLLSGTPANSRPVEPGDVVEVEVEGLGRLTNHIVTGPTAIRTDVGAQPTESEEVLSTALGGDWEFRGIRPPRR